MTQYEWELIDIARIIYEADPLSKDRKRQSVFARAAISKVLRDSNYSLQRIANVFDKDHATILHALNTHDDRIAFDKEYELLFNNFISKAGKKRAYIAGKITGLTESEYKDNFKRGETKLKNLGLHPVNPCKLPHKHDKVWESYMRESLRSLLTCNYVYALNNWKESKGAIIEVETAQKVGIKVIFE